MNTTHTSVRSVLEADREGNAAGQLSVKLALGCPRTDGTPGCQVRDILGRDGIKKFRADGDAKVSQVTEELPGQPKPFIDFEGAVDVGIVNETFPSDSCTGFLETILEVFQTLSPTNVLRCRFQWYLSYNMNIRLKRDSQVCPHDDKQVWPCGQFFFQEVRIFKGLFRRMN